ncbi:MAG: TIGR01620 family protein [Notoacmeibacter sp.]|nr:TIGR01620 family protein [Notoacmeibacter sp.]
MNENRTTPRRPAAFALPSAPAAPETEALKAEEPKAAKPAKTRKPAAIAEPALVRITPESEDPFLGPQFDEAALPPAPERLRRRGFSWRTLFFTTLGLLLSLAFGLWVDGLLRSLFSRSDWLGWTGVALAGLAALSLLAILVREMAALMRLSSVARLQADAADALTHSDFRPARDVTGRLMALLKDRPQVAEGRKLVAAQDNEVIDGPDLLALAEQELLGPLDAEARKIVTDAAKRVSIVTAVSPRALMDVGYVIFEASRLIRRIALLYGGRPGTLGFFRLARAAIAHLAVTGAMAASDSLVGQVLGHGLASRLSARLGEGVVNGLMTARIGIAAIETARPMPFNALKRPGMGDFLATLTLKSGEKPGPGEPAQP